MQSSEPLNRANISDDLADRLRAMIMAGTLPAGDRINEVHLSAKLGVSRTPLREALTRLVSEGALTAVPRIGFFVCPLSLEEFEQIYFMRAILDPEALRLAGLPNEARLAKLEALNKQILSATKVERAIALDDQWHMELLIDCPNTIIIGLIEQFMRRTRRYELAYLRERRNVERAVSDHKAIISALRARDLDRACAALRANMEGGKAPIVAWLNDRNTKKG